MDEFKQTVGRESNPAISVIILCYNHGKFVSEAIESALRQTFRDFEIIVVDDGSNDENTRETLAGLEKKYPGISLMRQENRGLAGARNAGVRDARGEFFLPLDADDTIEPEMLERCFEVLKSDSKLGFAFTSVRYFGDYVAVWYPRKYNYFDLLYANQFTSCALVRKKAWEEVGGYDENMRSGYEDWEFWINMGKHSWFGKLIPMSLFNYRRHELSMTDDARKRHKKNFAYIREKHGDLYTPEAQERIKSQWGSLVEEEVKRGKTFSGRLWKLKKKLELAGALSLKSWIKHPLRTFYRAIPIRWKTGGLVKLRKQK